MERTEYGKKQPTKQSGNDGLLKINFRNTFKTKGNEKICALILSSIPLTISTLPINCVPVHIIVCVCVSYWTQSPAIRCRIWPELQFVEIFRQKNWKKCVLCSAGPSSLEHFLNIHFIRIIMKWCVQVIISPVKFDSDEKHHQPMPVPHNKYILIINFHFLEMNLAFFLVVIIDHRKVLTVVRQRRFNNLLPESTRKREKGMKMARESEIGTEKAHTKYFGKIANSGKRKYVQLKLTRIVAHVQHHAFRNLWRPYQKYGVRAFLSLTHSLPLALLVSVLQNIL